MKPFHFVTYTLFCFVMIGSFYLIYLQDIEGTLIHKPISFSVDITNLKTDKAVYETGDTVEVYFSYCKHYDYEAVNTWNLVNSVVRPFPAKEFSAPSGCASGYYPVVVIPTDDAFIGNGTYHLQGESAIEINPFKTITIRYTTQAFRIQPNVKALIK